MQILAAHRRPLSRALLAVGAVGLAVVVGVASTLSTGDGAAVLTAKILAIGVFTACCFGGWQIVRFAVGTPPARRSDAAYLAVFALWVCWTLLGAVVYLYTLSM